MAAASASASPASAAPSARERALGLGRGVHSLIPGPDTPLTPADQATAALAALKAVPVQLGVLQAAVVLLDAMAHTTDDEATRTAAQTTAELLRDAVAPT